MKEAMFYEKLDDNKVHCHLCPQECRIIEENLGICRARKNVGGKLFSENYGLITSIAMDPIEKKPLYHFYPGSIILSVGSFGCNLRCAFCQNWEISQQEPESRYIEPQELIKLAKQISQNIGIAYTYNEPSIWYEYVFECAQLAKRAGLKNVLVTNGFINERPLREILKYIDAMNIDVKAYTNEFYKKVCGGRLDNVLKVVEIAASECHVEVTNLIVTGLNDKLQEIEDLSKWLSNIDKNIPLHFSRYFPNYRLQNPATPVELLKKAYDIGRKYLNFVYVGNVWGMDYNTYCPNCSNLLIERNNSVEIKGITKDNKCSKCGNAIKIQI